MGEDEQQDKGAILFPMEIIDRFRWNSDLGGRIKHFRENHAEGKITRPELEERLAAKKVKYGKEAIKKLEEGFYDSVDRDILLALLDELGTTPTKFFRARIQYIME